MKAYVLFFGLMFTLPALLFGQKAEEILKKVATAMDEERWSQAMSFFRQAIDLDMERAEMFYWTRVDKATDASEKMASDLAMAYKTARNYDKAYLFYKELLQKRPDNVDYLTDCAEMEVYRGKEKDALRTYGKALKLDPDNLAANIFIGNYYYLLAEKEKNKLDSEYRKISSPTRMQYARYRDGLNRVLVEGYAKAKGYLQKVILSFPSTEARKTLDKILLIEKEVNK